MNRESLFVVSVQHTGSHFLCATLNGEDFKNKGYLKIANNDVPPDETPQLFSGHFWIRNEWKIKELSRDLKTVVPLRHPVSVAISWKERDKTGFFDEWVRMMDYLEGDPFFFPMETKPYVELEAFIGRPVGRPGGEIATLGGYRAKLWWQTGQVEKVRKWLGAEEWDRIQCLLEDEPIARRFYAEETGIETQARS